MNRRECCAGLAGSLLVPSCADAPGANTGAPVRGLYQSEAGSVLAIGRFDEFGPGEFLFNYADNRCGKLMSRDRRTIVWASTFDGSGPDIAELEPKSDGVGIFGAAFHATPIDRRQFRVLSAGAEISGEIAHRAGVSPRGAILMVYGSGPAPKEALDFWTFHFIAQGWATITYDKRGSGQSTGDWRAASLETLANDAAAMIPHARKSLGLGARPLGAWGASQAGWILPQLGARGAVDFIVMHAGAATTPARQILDSIDAEMHIDGFPQEEIDRAKTYYSLDLDVSRGARPFGDLNAAYAIASGSRAKWLLAPPPAEHAPERTFMKLVVDFDPAPYWALSRAPVLSIFGGKDFVVPPAPNAALLERLIPHSAPRQTTILASANHLGFVATTGARAEYATHARIHPEYFPTIDTWLRRQV